MTNIYERRTKIAKQTPNGNTLEFSYNQQGNLIELSCEEDYTVDALFEYDNMGRRLTMSDVTGTTSFAYDTAGRLTKKIAPDQKSVMYQYDRAGNVVTKNFSGINRPDDWADASIPAVMQTISYTYTDANELESVALNGQELASYDYNRGGLLEQKTYTGVGEISYTFDALDRLKTLENKKTDSSVTSSQSYVYDQIGNKVQIMTSRGASTHAAAYRYDRKNQLVDEFFTDASAVNHRIAYTYDGTGNRSEVTETVSSQDIVRQYTVNSLNQVTAVARTASANQLPNLDIWGVFSGERTQKLRGQIT